MSTTEQTSKKVMPDPAKFHKLSSDLALAPFINVLYYRVWKSFLTPNQQTYPFHNVPSFLIYL